MRTGIGYAVHESREEGTPLLAGVDPSDSAAGSAGPPRPDPVARAVADAVRGAAGLPAAGSPGGDPAAGPRAPGLDLVARAVRTAEGENYQVVNVDVTVVAPGVTLSRHRAEVCAALAEHLHVSPGHVSVKPARGAATPAALGGDGPAALAVALLDRIEPMDGAHAALRAGG